MPLCAGGGVTLDTSISFSIVLDFGFCVYQERWPGTSLDSPSTVTTTGLPKCAAVPS